MLENCKDCGRFFRSKTVANVHQCPVSMSLNLPTKFGDFSITNHAFNRYLSVFYVPLESRTTSALYVDQQMKIVNFLRELMTRQSPLKVQFCTTMEMIKPLTDGVKREKISMCTRAQSLICAADVDEAVESYFKDLEVSIDQFTQRGTGWIIEKFDGLEIRVAKYEQDQGGCIGCDLPPCVLRKKAILKLDCHDDCFVWAVLPSLHPTEKNAERCFRYIQFFPDYDFSDVRGVVKLKSIDSFESRNDISVNVYTAKKRRIGLGIGQ